MFISDSYAQNLVPNYSFEIYDTCPNSVGQVYFAPPWGTASIYGSPDYFNSCSAPFGDGVPINWCGRQNAKDGGAYVGLVAYVHDPSDTTNYNAREYIQTELIIPLVANKCYRLSFFVSLADKYDYFKITNFGAYFSDTAVVDTALWTNTSVLNEYSPQFNYLDLAGIGDTSSWYKIEGIFQATGGEKFITMGNFNNDINTTAILYDPFVIPKGFCYYYVDSISLVELVCPIDIGINEPLNFRFSVFPNPTSEKFTIQLDKLENVTLTIHNMFGENVLETKLNSKSTDIDISSLDNGVYIISVENEKGTTRQKIIKNAH